MTVSTIMLLDKLLEREANRLSTEVGYLRQELHNIGSPEDIEFLELPEEQKRDRQKRYKETLAKYSECKLLESEAEAALEDWREHDWR